MSGCPLRGSEASPKAEDGKSTGRSGCPVSPVAGVGSLMEEINPANAMPTPNQQPADDQRLPLSTERIPSTIPAPAKGADGERTWLYPSPQMFFNAMRRKGYQPNEEEMRTVVAIHNTVNERSWQEVLKYESMYPECLETLKLLRFGGRPEEPTWKAQAYTAMGYKPPFDRHDWVVERCGKEVRYLIDYYNGRPTPRKPVAMHIDARPAGDSLTDVWDRLRMPAVQFMRDIGSGS
uniref:Holocytochrome c-type synthase n=1 Tax=Coccolithus braarudii TaxID=221442 RepID=A0A7S0L4G6_9EUKA|mmetsp:Transcript_19870/g.42762  ORF Transcript_19870/g.42762 Transcript_19870/m.42762 type:complete len:235 (+) Transcript_19870:41-745(+)